MCMSGTIDCVYPIIPLRSIERHRWIAIHFHNAEKPCQLIILLKAAFPKGFEERLCRSERVED